MNPTAYYVPLLTAIRSMEKHLDDIAAPAVRHAPVTLTPEIEARIKAWAAEPKKREPLDADVGEPIECTDCHGRGETWQWAEPSDHQVSGWVECRACNGRGVVQPPYVVCKECRLEYRSPMCPDCEDKRRRGERP